METSNSKTGKNDHSSNSHMMASGRAISSAPIATSAYPAGMSSNLGQQGRGFPATGTAFRPQQQQPQAQQQDVNTPQFLQLVSSLMGNTNNTSNNGNSSAGSFMSLGSNDLLSMAQRMGIFQQLQQQTPNNGAGLQGLPTISQAQCLPTASSVTGTAQSSPPPQKQNLSPQKMQPSLKTPAVVKPTAEASEPQTKKLKTDTGHQLTRIPCRARGMNMDHNFETAYFAISEDMKHGSPLVCSYPACRDKGVKFLYCAFCKDTGAKRQFRERHNHGADDETVRRSSQVSQTPTETPSTSATKVPRAGGKLKTAPGTSDNEALPIGKRKRTTIEVVAAATHNTNTSMEDATTSSIGRRKGPLQDLDEAIAQSAIDVEDERMKVWTALLSSRPKDNNDDGIASWLMNAMAVSDVSRPIKEVVEELERNPNVPKFTNIKSSTAPAVALSVQATTSSTDLEDSNDSFSSGKRSSSTDGQTNTQDGSSNDSNEDTSTDNQDANSDEQDPTSSSPNDSSDDDYQMDAEAGMAIDGEKQGSGV
mmetsp:Transcript_26211/g.46534  ORF Transcript_26211/g.46534 Transcript_26211/m.46534 type:complete len:534 (+) Transcript_26211:140-1741(+)